MKLVIFEASYADEFNTSGFAIMDDGEWDALETFSRSRKWPVVWHFGTNEDVEFENAKEYLGYIRTEDINPAQAVFLERLFGGKTFGLFPNVSLAEKNEEDGSWHLYE